MRQKKEKLQGTKVHRPTIKKQELYAVPVANTLSMQFTNCVYSLGSLDLDVY